MPTQSQVRFAQVVSAGIDRQIEQLTELIDRTLERLAARQRAQHAVEEMQMQRSA